jgi:hypothetical protein
MELIHNIRTVARYEARILRRSWFFRLFSLGALFIFSILNLGLFSPIGDEDWQIVAFSASVPHINLYLLNIGQAIVVIFLASDFLKRDKKVDTNEVLYTRSMSNFEYITGKTTGVLRLFLGLDIIILLIGLLMNIISKTMTIDLASYFWFLIIICIPTIIFSLGLSFMLMSLLRNQAITFLILLGIAALNMFWLNFRFGYIFDYMAFGLPVFKSGMIGFDNPSLILNQRLTWLFLGLSLILATILLFKRLPQSRVHTTVSAVFMVIFLGLTAFCAWNTWSFYRTDLNDKRTVIDTNRLFENSSFASLSRAEIDFEHLGDSFSASADLHFTNNNVQPLDTYLFSLNPGLRVGRVSSSGKELNYKMTGHIIAIDPAKPLAPGEKDSISISWSGKVDETFCFPDNNDNVNTSPYRVAMLNVNKRQAFLTPDYVLLTPESHWYPVPGLNYYPSNPARLKVDFTEFILKVKTREDLMPVAQGNMKKEGYNNVITSDSPLTGLSLAIGNYRSDTLTVDSVTYITYYYPGHDYYKKDLSELKDTLTFLVSGIMRDIETSYSAKYPFSTLKLVEVPVQFRSFPRMSTQTMAELQPSMVLLPEKLAMIDNAGFRKRFTRQKKRNTRNNQVITDKELQVRLFNDFARNAFISGEKTRYVNGERLSEPVRYRLGPNFYFYRNNFRSAEYPVINAVFESHLQKQISETTQLRNMTGDLQGNDRANLVLRNISFRDVLSMNPKGDTIRTVLSLKGDYLFNLFRAKAGIEEFNDWFTAYLDNHRYRSIEVTDLNTDMKEKFGFEFYPYLHDWFNGKDQPGFIFSGIQAREIIVANRVRFLVTFTASNPEPVTGIFNVSFRTAAEGGRQVTGYYEGSGRGGSYSMMMQGQGPGSDISGIVVLGPAEAKKISIILDAEPREMIANSLFAKNIPGEIVLPIDNILKSRNHTAYTEGEELLPSVPPLESPGEIVVDNEDPGFSTDNSTVMSPLKRILGVKKRQADTYQSVNMFWAPQYWQAGVMSSYYGKYIRSSVFTRGSRGEKLVTWVTPLTKADYYDIYCYIGKSADRMVVRSGGAPPPPPGETPQGNIPYKDLHYRIYHDEGSEDISIDFGNAEPGWNLLGRYYISSDSARVEMTNQSTGRVVIGDAVKWVRAN